MIAGSKQEPNLSAIPPKAFRKEATTMNKSPFNGFFGTLSPEQARMLHEYLDSTPDAVSQMLEEITEIHGKVLIKMGYLSKPRTRRGKVVIA